ncbi:MAG: putative DNA-binding domain-containing protein [Idiomarina sp.]|nr:putative DNA-binding domain-containing protein [Idiomarina sp.]
MSKMTFKEIQNRFVEQLKAPEKFVDEAWLDEIEARRLAVYQRLLRNNIFRFIDSAFPVLKKLTAEKEWAETKERFFRTFSSQSPYFTGIAASFVEYLQSHDELFIFAAELAHYEWAELAVEQKPWPENYINPAEALESDSLIALNPTAMVSSYQYPVDEISTEFQPQESLPEPRFLIVFRDNNDKVRFIRINAMTFLLLTELQNRESIQLNSLLGLLPELLPQWPEDHLQKGAEQTLNKLAGQQLILKVKN